MCLLRCKRLRHQAHMQTGATGLLMRHACTLLKDWYNVFHVLVVHVGTSLHPTLLNVMHVIWELHAFRAKIFQLQIFQY